jgi:hypothetical protein
MFLQAVSELYGQRLHSVIRGPQVETLHYISASDTVYILSANRSAFVNCHKALHIAAKLVFRPANKMASASL